MVIVLNINRGVIMTIREMRILTGLSQQKFGDSLGVPLRTVQSWEAGERKCPDYVIKLIEYYLKHEKMI